MIIQVVLAVVLGGLAVGVAGFLRQRDQDAPQQGASWAVPTQVDRRDFDRPDAPWLVVVFSSATCLSCQDVWAKAVLLESDAVAVTDVEAVEHKALHDQYQIDAVPMILVVDAEGNVRRSFIGAPTATDLWAALAELRAPGTVPPECTDH